MDSQELIEREARTGRFAGILGIGAGLILLGAAFSGLGSDFFAVDGDEYAAQLEQFELVRDDMLLRALLIAAGVLLFMAPLVYLFRAAAARNEGMKRNLIGLAIAGPIFLAASQIMLFLGFDSVAGPFNENLGGGTDANEAAKDALSDEPLLSLSLGTQLAGLVSTGIAMLYGALSAMRVGLLTRFLGTMGMALAVAYLFLAEVSYAVWALTISPLIAGWWFAERPPAWAAGKAVPWPVPGQAPPDEPEQLADPSEFADEDGDGLPDGPDREESESAKTRTSAKKRKKRKR
jgi:hypothetical protein